ATSSVRCVCEGYGTLLFKSKMSEGGRDVKDGGLQDGNTSNGRAIGQVYEVTNYGNPNENGLEFVIKEAPTSYANKLNPTSLTNVNLQKLDAKVPNDVDFDIWLPLASDHEVLKDGLRMIHGVLIFLNKWSPSMSLLKEELSRVPVWVKFHDVPIIAYTSDGLSLIAKKIGSLMMLDSYMNSMCLES
nr:hypothetical protein [Tanacetum cinerariifolium]